MSPLRFVIIQFVFLSAVSCFAAESTPMDSSEPDITQSETQKSTVLKRVAQDWILVGMTQYKRGLYQEAEKSFLNAAEYKEYLTDEENKQLEEHLSSTRRAAEEKQSALERIKTANELINQGQPIKARAYYEQVRNSQYLTEQQRNQIADEIKKVDQNFDKQMNEITALYNRSVELYRTGEYEKAREGFAEVARYGQYVAPEGRSAEDYLIQIDSILTERFMQDSSVKPILPPISQPVIPPVEKSVINEQPEQKTEEQTAEVTAVAEPTPIQPESNIEAKAKILRTYTKAVVEDTVTQVQRHILRRDFGKAIDSVRKATNVVSENRLFIGDDLFAQYSILLKQLTDKIIEAQKE